MNATIYLFGEFNYGYSQYPDDYTSKVFKKIFDNSKSTTQVVIHRDGNLMYYVYIRKLEQSRYIGFCIVLNNLLLTQCLDGLFNLFENTVSRLVQNGQLIHFNDVGEIVTNVEQLYLNIEEIDLIDQSLRAGLNRFENEVKSLPAVNYGVSKDSSKDFVISDNLDDIVRSSYTNSYTFVYKSYSFNTSQMNSYKGVLTRVRNEKKVLQEENEKLKKVLSETIREKKQFKFVIFLFVILLGCGVFLFLLNDNLVFTRNALSCANDTISMQYDSLSIKNNHILRLVEDSIKLENYLQEALKSKIESDNKLKQFNDIISSRQPFFIKNSTFDFNSGYLKIDYYGFLESMNSFINIYVYNDKGLVVNKSAYISIAPGNNSTSIFINNNLDGREWYSFEILKGNAIIGGNRH